MQADYLTLTHQEPLLNYHILGAVDGVPLRRQWFGADGWYYEPNAVYVGSYVNRHIVNVAGPTADSVVETAVGYLAGRDFSCARLDLQVTLNVPDANAIIESLTPHRRYKSVLVKALDPRSGSTLYVGSPGSRKRLRVYNKSKQADIELPAGELIRVELVLRDANADSFLLRWINGGKEACAHLFRSTVTAMAPGLDDVVPAYPNNAHIEVDVPPPLPRYLAWLESSVLPGIQKARLLNDAEVIEVLKRIRDLLS